VAPHRAPTRDESDGARKTGAAMIFGSAMVRIDIAAINPRSRTGRHCPLCHLTLSALSQGNGFGETAKIVHIVLSSLSGRDFRLMFRAIRSMYLGGMVCALALEANRDSASEGG